MWHVSSRSGVATLRTAIHLLLTYLQWRNDGVAAASSDGGPTGGCPPDSSRVLSD